MNTLYELLFFPQLRFWKGIFFFFPCYLANTADEVEHPCCLSSHGDFLGILGYNFSIFQSTQYSPTREKHGTDSAL